VKTILRDDMILRASVAMSTFLPSTAMAANADCPSNPSTSTNPIGQGANCSQSNSSASSLFGPTGIFTTIANTLIFLVGAVAVIMLIIGGLRYVISQGNKEQVESAKNTILYSVIGIVVAIVSYAVVNWVTGALAPNATTNS